MRRARILLLAVATAIAVVVAMAAVLPAVMDWNRYRGSLEGLAGEALGRPVTIAGPISLSLFPEPVLTASRVRVGDGRDGVRILIAELRLRVALVPLLMGRVDARSLTLQRPDLRIPWPPWHGLPSAVPPWLSLLSARIENGRVAAAGLVLNRVNATLTAGSGHAALTLEGSATVGQGAWQLRLQLGEPAADGTAPLEASLSGAGATAGVAGRLTGRLAPDGELRGHVAFDGPDLANLLAMPPLRFHADGGFALRRGVLRLDALAVALGSVIARGSGRLVLAPAPRLDLALSSESTVPLDPWIRVLRRGGESHLPVGLTLMAPRATLAHGLLQHLRLALVFGPGGARIGAFQAILPGEAVFAAEGRIVRAPQEAASWQFNGTAHLAAPALASTVHWLDAAAPGVLPPLPAAVMGRAKIGGRVIIGAAGIALSDLEGTVDRSKVTGSLTLGLGGRPAISAGLTLDRLALDPWLPRALREAPLRQGFPLAMVPRLFTGMSVELRLVAAEATLGRAVISGLSLDGAAESGRVILRRLDATVEGVHVIASGAIGTGGTVTAGRLALTAAGPAVLAKWLPPPFGPAIGRWRAAFSLDATVAGPPQRLGLGMEATLGDLRVTADPVVNLKAGTWQGPVTLRHPGAAELVGASGFADPTNWLGPGSLSLIGQAVGGPEGWSLRGFRLVAGSLRASGRLRVARGGVATGPVITGLIHAATLPVPGASGAMRLLLGLVGGRSVRVGVRAKRVTAGSRVLLEDAEGRLDVAGREAALEVNGNAPGGGALAAVFRMAVGGGPPSIRIGAALAGVHLKGPLFGAVPDLAAGTLAGEAALSARGYGPGALVATLGGTVALKVRDGIITGVSLRGAQAALAGTGPKRGGAVALGRALAGGQSRFDRLTLIGRGSGGRFRVVHGRMVSANGVITAEGTIDLPTESENLRLTLRPALVGAPATVVRLSGPVARPKRLKEIATALQWLAGRSKKH